MKRGLQSNRHRPGAGSLRRSAMALAICALAGPFSGPAAGAFHGRAQGDWEAPRVAVIREDAVWTVRAGGRFAPLPHSRGADRALWSPDGRYLAVHKRDGSLWVIAAEGGRSWLVARDRVDPHIAWAPRTDRLAYVRGCDLWVVPFGGAGPEDWTLAAADVDRFAWAHDGERLFVSTPAWFLPPPPPLPGAGPPEQSSRQSARPPGIAAVQKPVQIIEVPWRGGSSVLWGELPRVMAGAGHPASSGRTSEEGTGEEIWGLDGVFPSPDGRAVAVVVRETPDPGKARTRRAAALTGRSAAPVWAGPPSPGIRGIGWAVQAGRSWFAYLVTGEDRTSAGTSPPRSRLVAWSPEHRSGTLRPLTPEGADDRFASAHAGGSGWIVARALERPWAPHRLGPRSLWLTRPDGRSVPLTRPPLGREDAAGWWGPGEQWAWLRTDGRRAQLHWWRRDGGVKEGTVLLEELPPESTGSPETVHVLFPAERRA
ncbi:MAG: hypothetical protein QJR06_04800 [Alicyclobacillaceae bacterium]|nr:hypothetical protein [Alicyclobacillaceae bacterium]